MRNMKVLWSLPLFALTGYAAIVAGMALMEPKLVFPAPQVGPEALAAAAAAAGAEPFSMSSEDGTRLYGWRYAAGHDRLALLFGGNGATVSAYGPRHQRLLAAGFDVLHVNYRGYPGSEGAPSEDGLLMDARAAWAEARRRFPPERILVFGKSLGGGVAMGLVSGLPEGETPGALVVESTFTSTVEVARRSYPWLPVSMIMRNRFESQARAPAVRAPVLVVHSPADEVIPFDMSEALCAALPDARRVAVPGQPHNADLLADPEAWLAFLDIAPAPQGR